MVENLSKSNVSNNKLFTVCELVRIFSLSSLQSTEHALSYITRKNIGITLALASEATKFYSSSKAGAFLLESDITRRRNVVSEYYNQLKGEIKMARPKMITRTVKYTNATAMILNIETAEPYNRTFKLPGTYKNEKDMLDAIALDLPADERAVTIVDTDVCTQLMGVTEADFLSIAHEVVKNSKNTENAGNEEE